MKPELTNAELAAEQPTDPVLSRFPGYWRGSAARDARWLARERAREALLRGLLGEGKP